MDVEIDQREVEAGGRGFPGGLRADHFPRHQDRRPQAGCPGCEKLPARDMLSVL